MNRGMCQRRSLMCTFELHPNDSGFDITAKASLLRLSFCNSFQTPKETHSCPEHSARMLPALPSAPHLVGQTTWKPGLSGTRSYLSFWKTASLMSDFFEFSYTVSKEHHLIRFHCLTVSPTARLEAWHNIVTNCTRLVITNNFSLSTFGPTHIACSILALSSTVSCSGSSTP
jgi:hypothetical protein